MRKYLVKFYLFSFKLFFSQKTMSKMIHLFRCFGFDTCCFDRNTYELPKIKATVCIMGMEFDEEIESVYVNTSEFAYEYGLFIDIQFIYELHGISCNQQTYQELLMNDDELVFAFPESKDHDMYYWNNYNTYIDGLVKVTGYSWLKNYKNKFDISILNKYTLDKKKDNFMEKYPNFKLNVNLFDGLDIQPNISNEQDLNIHWFNDWKLANSQEIDNFKKFYPLFDEDRMYLMINQKAGKQLVLLNHIRGAATTSHTNMEFMRQYNPNILVGDFFWSSLDKREVKPVHCQKAWSDTYQRINPNFWKALEYANTHGTTVVLGDTVLDILMNIGLYGFYKRTYSDVLSSESLKTEKEIVDAYVMGYIKIKDVEQWFSEVFYANKNVAKRSYHMWLSLMGVTNEKYFDKDASKIIGYFNLRHLLDIILWIKKERKIKEFAV